MLTAGRPDIGLYLSEGSSLDLHKVDMREHHNAYGPALETSGHTDVVPIGPHSLLFIYDSIPDGWRYPGSPFTRPDEIFAVRVDIEKGEE